MKHFFSKKKIFFAFLLSLLFVTQVRAQVLTSSTDVMLQGFYWDSHSETRWALLKNQAEEINTYFDMIWLPPSAQGETGGSSDVGYHPKNWSNQNSSWGSKDLLISLIKALHAGNTKVIADVVINHRAGTGWCTFPADNYGTGYTTYQFTNEHICKDDEAKQGGGNTSGIYPTGGYDYKYNVSGDYWGGYAAARDLDHSSDYVRSAIKEYMKYLKNEIGYDGWRYDLVKGYDPKYTKEYNEAAAAYFSVGEYWDGNVTKLKEWINGTGKTSTAFDFASKYTALNNSLVTNKFAGMISGGKPAGLVGDDTYKQYAVTFVDNHDTYRDGSKYIGNVPKAYAFILSAAGTPCVFYPHWQDYKVSISSMIAARKAVGLHNQSAVTASNKTTYYESTATGLHGSLICRIGALPTTAPTGYTLACSGPNWAYYTKLNGAPGETITPYPGEDKIESKPDPELVDEITIRFKAPSSWTKVAIWAWDYAGTTNYTGGVWPGTEMTADPELPGYYTYTITGLKSPYVGVVFNNGVKTGAVQTVNLLTSESVCWEATTLQNGKYNAVVNNDLNPGGSSIDEVSQLAYSFYPNPVSDVLTIQSEVEIKQVNIQSFSGASVISSTENEISMRNLPSGFYLMTITFENGITKTEKLIKR